MEFERLIAAGTVGPLKGGYVKSWSAISFEIGGAKDCFTSLDRIA